MFGDVFGDFSLRPACLCLEVISPSLWPPPLQAPVRIKPPMDPHSPLINREYRQRQPTKSTWLRDLPFHAMGLPYYHKANGDDDSRRATPSRDDSIFHRSFLWLVLSACVHGVRLVVLLIQNLAACWREKRAFARTNRRLSSEY